MRIPLSGQSAPRGEPLLAIAIALLGWIPVMLAAELAMGGAGLGAVAACMASPAWPSSECWVAGRLRRFEIERREAWWCKGRDLNPARMRLPCT